MAATTLVTAPRPPVIHLSPRASTLVIRAGLLAGLAVAWEALSWSRLLIREVTPPLEAIATAIVKLLSTGTFYVNAGVSVVEVLASLAIGSALGVATGIVLGASPFLSRAYEPFVYYLAPTPRIILFPVTIMWFGLGMPSKIALGAVSAFFAVALSTAAGMRRIDPVLVRVGVSFRLSRLDMARKIYMPAMRMPIVTGIQLGFSGAFLAVLLAETKLSNQGLGYVIMEVYARFDMPALYGVLLIAFALAGAANQLLGRLARR